MHPDLRSYKWTLGSFAYTCKIECADKAPPPPPERLRSGLSHRSHSTSDASPVAGFLARGPREPRFSCRLGEPAPVGKYPPT